jgi:hypothetical protein
MIVFLEVALAASISGQEIRTQVSDLRLGRLYFPFGEELHVYQHSPFVVLRGEDTVYGGHIEHSWLGVSVSLPTDGFFDTLRLDSLEVEITPARVDSTARVTIGTNVAGLQLLTDSVPNARIELGVYDDERSLLDDFNSGLVDGIITLSDLTARPDNVTTICHNLPYLVALVPNMSRACNAQGQLTTSLYYRFDDSRLAVTFDGDRVSMVNRLVPVVDSAAPAGRLYACDPSRGRALFDGLTPRPVKILIYSGNPLLDGVALYFADIISRDRCQVQLTENRREADIRVDFLPFSQSLPSSAVYAAYHMLVTDSVSGSPANEHLRRLEVELTMVESAVRYDDYYRHLAIAGRIMSEDLGAFPLFRPTLFLHSHKRLQNVGFDRDGRLDFRSAVIVELPQPVEERPQ